MTNSHLLRDSLTNSCAKSKENGIIRAPFRQHIDVKERTGCKARETTGKEGGYSVGEAVACSLGMDQDDELRFESLLLQSPDLFAFVVDDNDFTEAKVPDGRLDLGEVTDKDEHGFCGDGVHPSDRID